MLAQLHPDKNTGDPEAVDKFQRIATSHAVLTDAASRNLQDSGGGAPFAIATCLKKQQTSKVVGRSSAVVRRPRKSWRRRLLWRRGGGTASLQRPSPSVCA